MKENFIAFIEKSIVSNWENHALADYKGSSFTYKEVATQMMKLHIVFEKEGVKPGDKIALVGKNSAAWGITFLSAISYGAVIVPILPDFTPEDTTHIINHSDSVILFTGEQIFESLDISKMPDIRAVIHANDFSLIFSREGSVLPGVFDTINELFAEHYPNGFEPGNFHLQHVPNHELAVISYTSGTTGYSKGVMIPHNSLIANIRYAHENMPLEPKDQIVSFLPLAHSYGCAFEFLFPFTLGCYITFLGKTPSPAVIMQAFKEIRPRLILSVPLVIEKIYKKQVLPTISKPVMKILLKTPLINSIIRKKIRQKLFEVFGGNFHEIVIGGAAFNKEAELFFKKIKFPFSIGYGMTECGPLIAYAGWEKARLGSAGKLVDTLEIKIDSTDPYHISGEIMVRGENLMLGYYKNAEATRDALDDEGWLHTGDLGYLDKDNYVYINGRSKSMILGASGQNIYPEEIEAKINNLPFVTESVVIDEGQRLVALIFPDKEMMEKEGVDESKLKEVFEEQKKQLNHSLPVYSKVAEFRIHPEEFEKTPKRSIKRFMYNK
ncbi:MAG: AMP-binding protein [Bacteroidales bacterium]|nr:AMP-binding protein [Bacteroidales bacterium]MCB9000199.1 AMP-binding protein [Bacteroidales bacterium]MCB9013722.1 AMP-binding protein [Bacteroidales bacterium]